MGHNDDVILEKFKDVFPDPNIEAALIAMDDFALMQKKAKQLVHIYKPAHDSPMHPLLYLFILRKIQLQKVNRLNLKAISINWPLLINLKHLTVRIPAIMTIMEDNEAEDAEITEAPVDVEIVEILITDMTIKNVALEEVKGNVILTTVEGVVKIIHIEDDEDSGMVMTQITVTETIGIEIPIVKVILTGVDDGIIIVGVKEIGIVEEGDAGIPISSIMIQGINRSLNFKIQITTDHPQWDINTGTRPHMVSIHTHHNNNNNTRHKCQRLLNKPLISVNCAIVKAIMIINAICRRLYGMHTKSL